MHRFHVLGIQDDREGEDKAAQALANALVIVTGAFKKAKSEEASEEAPSPSPAPTTTLLVSELEAS